ncbi:MAG: hypothetical protein ACYC7A_05440 [Thermoanaerobaculia bacterium]
MNRNLFSHLLRAAAGFLLAVAALPLHAQLITDRVPRERTVPLRDQIKKQSDESRFRFGPIRVRPRFTLTNAGYVDNVFGAVEGETVDDWTATVGAGLEALMPMGRKVYLRGSAIPEYTYYADLVEMRNLGGTYSGGALALFNRVSFEATGSRSESVMSVSSELERTAIVNLDRAVARAEIDILERLSIFGAYEAQERRYEEEIVEDVAPIRAARLDRDETAARAGIRYRFRSHFEITAGVEETTSEFVNRLDAPSVDYDTTATLVGIHYDRPRFFLELNAGQREGDPRGASVAPAFDELTGSYFLSLQPTERIEFQGFGERSVVPSLSETAPYFIESRNGLGLQLRVGSRTAFRVRGEVGKNDYAVFVEPDGTGALMRNDDVTAYGGGLAIRLFRDLTLNVDATRTEYDSNIDGFDRSVVRITTGISFSGAPTR